MHRSAKLFFIIIVVIAGLPKIGKAQKAANPKFDNYFTGIRLYENGLFEESVKTLHKFIENHPGNTINQSAYYYLVRAEARLDSTNTPKYFEQYLNRYPKGDKAVNLLVELGNLSDKNGAYDKSVSYYKRALGHKPGTDESSRIMFWMAQAASEMGKNDLSRSYYLTLADSFPKTKWAPRALYARGRSFLNEENYSSSTQTFEILKKRYPNDPVTRRVGTALGESYYKQKRYGEAIDALKNAMPYLDDESKSKAVYLIAESYNFLNNYTEASNYYLRFINMNKGSDKTRLAYYGLGWVYNKEKIYHWAADAFGRAAAGNDEVARKALYYKAVNEKLGGYYERAIKTFREFGKKYKNGDWVEPAYYEWAMTAFQTGRYSEAIQACLTLIRSGKKLKEPGKLFSLLGEAYFANNEYTRAMQAFDEASKSVNVNPSINRKARFQKAWVLFQNQAYEQAQPQFETVYKSKASQKLKGESLFWSANAYYHMKKYSKAAGQFADFIQKFPHSQFVGAARYSLGWARFKMGEYNQAISPFKEFLKHYNPPSIALFPYDVDTKLRIGDSYYALKEYDQAIQYYSQVIGSDPGGDYALYQIANSYYRSDQSYEAVTTLRKLLKMYPNSTLREQAQYNIGYIYFLINNYQQAIQEFQKVIKQYPGSSWAARAQYNIGDAYYNAAEFKKSIAAYKKVMTDYPKSDYIIEAVNGIQYAQIAAGNKDTSSEILEEYLSQHPESNMADKLRFRQAQNLLESGDYNGAVKSLKEYLRITNNDRMIPEAYYNIADAYEQENNIPKAINAYKTVVDNYKSSDRYGTCLASLGRLYYHQENYAQSLNYYTELSSVKGYHLESYLGMGNAYLSLQQPDSARQEFQKALHIQNGNDAAKLGLAKVSYSQKNYDSALPDFETIAQKNTTAVGAEAQFMIGQTLEQQGQYNQAIKEFGKVKVLYAAFDSWVAKAMLGSAHCYVSLGNKPQAESILKQIVKTYPNTQAAQEAVKELKSK